MLRAFYTSLLFVRVLSRDMQGERQGVYFLVSGTRIGLNLPAL